MRVSLEERFWLKVDKGDGCWVWTAARNKRGVGILWFRGSSTLASLVSWKLTCGPIPANLCVTQRCQNAACVRPDHLFLAKRRGRSPDPMPTEDRFWEKVQKGAADECWPWTAGKHTDGYGLFKCNRKSLRSNRVVWELTHGAIPNGSDGEPLGVLHSCDNPPCCNPAHLFLGTAADNVADMVTKGRHAQGERSGPRRHPESRPRGERHWKRKLTESMVRDARLHYEAGGVSLHALARSLGVSVPTVSSAVKRETWKHVV